MRSRFLPTGVLLLLVFFLTKTVFSDHNIVGTDFSLQTIISQSDEKGHPLNKDCPESPVKEENEKDSEESEDTKEKEFEINAHRLKEIIFHQAFLLDLRHPVKHFYCNAASGHRAYYMLFHSWKHFLK